MTPFTNHESKMGLFAFFFHFTMPSSGIARHSVFGQGIIPPTSFRNELETLMFVANTYSVARANLGCWYYYYHHNYYYYYYYYIVYVAFDNVSMNEYHYHWW